VVVPLIAVLAACGSDGGGTPGEGDGTAPDAETRHLTGVVSLSPNSDPAELLFSDPATGETHTTLTLPVAAVELQWDATDGLGHSGPLDRRTFSADWRYAAWVEIGDVVVARLDPEADVYETVARISGAEEGGYSSEPVEYWNPRFSPDGERLWFEARTENGTELTLASVPFRTVADGDSAQAGDLGFAYDPNSSDGRDYPSYWRWEFDPEGVPVVTPEDAGQEINSAAWDNSYDDNVEPWARYWADPEGAVLRAEFAAPIADSGNATGYQVLRRTAPGEYLLMPDDARNEHFGAIARATIDPESGTLDLVAAVPMGTDEPSAAVVSSDGAEALLHVAEKWYRADLTASAGAEPTPVEAEYPEWADNVLLDWS
jgi:hypothetical protein